MSNWTSRGIAVIEAKWFLEKIDSPLFSAFKPCACLGNNFVILASLPVQIRSRCGAAVSYPQPLPSHARRGPHDVAAIDPDRNRSVGRPGETAALRYANTRVRAAGLVRYRWHPLRLLEGVGR